MKGEQSKINLRFRFLLDFAHVAMVPSARSLRPDDSSGSAEEEGFEHGIMPLGEVLGQGLE